MQATEKSRYSKQERENFREVILKKLEKARKDLNLIKESFTNGQDNGTEDTSPAVRTFEDCTDTLSKEQESRLMEHLQKYIYGLEKALIRVETPEYGICRITGKLIPESRLLLVPHTTLSIQAKQSLEGNKK